MESLDPMPQRGLVLLFQMPKLDEVSAFYLELSVGGMYLDTGIFNLWRNSIEKLNPNQQHYRREI